MKLNCMKNSAHLLRSHFMNFAYFAKFFPTSPSKRIKHLQIIIIKWKICGRAQTGQTEPVKRTQQFRLHKLDTIRQCRLLNLPISSVRSPWKKYALNILCVILRKGGRGTVQNFNSSTLPCQLSFCCIYFFFIFLTDEMYNLYSQKPWNYITSSAPDGIHNLKLHATAQIVSTTYKKVYS